MNTTKAVEALVDAAFRQYGGSGPAGARVIRMRGFGSGKRSALGKISDATLRKMLRDEPDREISAPKVFQLTLDMPPSANRYWRQRGQGGVFISDEAEDYKSDVALIARTQGVKDPLAGDIVVRIKVFRKQKSGDLDNRLKVLIDALKGVAWVDDKQIVEIHAYRFEDKANPRVEVEFMEMGAGV